MTGIGEDTEAELSMLINNYISLRTRCPNHSLLQFVELHEDNRGIILTPKFRRRFWRKGDELIIYSYSRYNEKLKEAISGGQENGRN